MAPESGSTMAIPVILLESRMVSASRTESSAFAVRTALTSAPNMSPAVALTNSSGKTSRLVEKNWTRSDSYEKLNMPVVDMIKALRQESQVDIATPTITVFPSTFTHHVIAKLAATKVHRVYIVGSDADYRPIGVITQTSILKKIATLLDQSE